MLNENDMEKKEKIKEEYKVIKKEVSRVVKNGKREANEKFGKE